MYKYLVFLLILCYVYGKSQISLNTNGDPPDASAAWDVQFTNKGILIPRVALTSTTDGTTIPSPATSLLVYNNGTGGLTPAGYYYNAGTSSSPNWVRFLVGKEAWMITGNDNTDPTNNFLGTTNDQHLQFRTNNINRMRIMSSSYSSYPTIGIGTIVPVVNLDGSSAVLHVHDGGNSVGSQLILSTHSTTAGDRAGGVYFAATQVTNNRTTAAIKSYLTAYSGGNASGDLRFFTNNSNTVQERMRLYETGQLVLSDNATFPSPTTNYLFTINPTTNTYRSAISIPMSGATLTAYAINVSTGNANSRGYFYENTSGSNGVFFGAGAQLSTTNIASGFLAYRNSSGLTYGLYGINGTNAAYATNANVWAAFIQGRAVISSESSPSSPLGVDLEIRNTTAGSGNPATLSMRQTTSETTSGTTLARLNFGDNNTTNPQAQISILREAASSGSGDLPTAITFSTTADGSATLLERMRIANNGYVGIGTATPIDRLDIQGGNVVLGNNITNPYTSYVLFGTLGSFDTRSTNPNPEAYFRGIISEFKQNSANGLNDGGTYNSVLSIRQWGSGTDWSGGGVHQIGFTQNGNIWHRYSQTTGSWGPWKKLYDSGMGGIITCSNANYVIKSNGTDGVCSQIYDNGTNVGIGTNSPTSLLHVYKNANENKYVIRGEALQTSTSSDYQNVGIYGYARGGNSSWGYSAGVMGIADQANSWYAVGVYGGLGTGAENIPSVDAAVYGNGGNLGYGVYGSSNYSSGVYGSGSTYGVYGYTPSTNNGTFGVYGAWSSAKFGYLGGRTTAGYYVGVYGSVDGASDFSVLGWNTNPSGTAVVGGGNNVSSVYYLTNGSGGAFTGNNIGVYGYASSTASSTNRFGGYFANAASYAYVGGTTSDNVNRKIEGNGTVNTVIKDLNDNLVVMSCPEAPENLFIDYGVGKLENGKAHIVLDPIFAKNIVVDENHPLRVFIQLRGNCNGVYVTNETNNSFDVIELNGGTSNVSFYYQVVANRADEVLPDGSVARYSAERFAPAIGPQKVNSNKVIKDYNEDIKWKESPFENLIKDKIKK